MSSGKAKSLKTFLLSQLRKILGFKDRESPTLAHLWNEGRKAKFIPSDKKVDEHWSLIPIKKDYWKSTRMKFDTIIPFLERHFDKFFCVPTPF